MNLSHIDTVVQFTPGSSSSWNSANVPVPAGAVVIDTANKIMKEGDGVTLFADLPVCFDYNFNTRTSGAIAPGGDHVGLVVSANNSLYSPSTTKFSDILNALTTAQNKATSQQTTLNGVGGVNNLLTVSAGTVDGTIVVCNNGTYGPGTKTLTQFVADLIASAGGGGTGSMHITDLAWYSDVNLTQPVNYQNDITENTTYYCQITGWHDTAELRCVDFGLSTSQSGVTVTSKSTGVSTCSILVATYGHATGSESYIGVATDTNGNIFCVGYTNYEGGTLGNNSCIIVKYDTNMNIVARKNYAGASQDVFQGVAIDPSNNNVFVTGYSQSEGLGTGDCLTIKFDNNLNILVRKLYGGSLAEGGYGIALDRLGNVIVVGQTNSDTAGVSDCLIIKYDNNLNPLYSARYGGTGNDQYFAVATDAQNNIICVGYTMSEGVTPATYRDGIIIKYNPQLVITNKVRYGGNSGTNEQLNSVAVDSKGNVFIGGHTNAEGTAQDAVILKLDTNMVQVAKKIYGGTTSSESFFGVAVDGLDNVICCGYTGSEGLGGAEGIIVKYDNNLNILGRKRAGGTGTEYLNWCCTDSKNDIIIVGYTTSIGAGGQDAVVIKLPAIMPAGSATGAVLPGFTIADSKLIDAAPVLALATSALTAGTLTKTHQNSNLTLMNSALTAKNDTLTLPITATAGTLLTAVYTSAGTDVFNAVAINGAGNIVAVGSSTVTVGGQALPLAVLFDSTFKALSRVTFANCYSGVFQSVAIDVNGKIVGVGSIKATSGSNLDAFILKLDADLTTILISKTYGGASDDVFYDVATDSSANVICVGYTTAVASTLKDTILAKFDTNLNFIIDRAYGYTSNDVYTGIACDSSNNIIMVGYYGVNALIVKCDNGFNIIGRRYYNSSLGTATEFSSVAVTAAGNIYCVGRVVIAAGNKGLVVVLATDLTITDSKLYGSTTGNTEFTGVIADGSNNLICVGKTSAEGVNDYDAVVLKMNAAFTILGHKTYGTVGTDIGLGCVVTGTGDIILCGYGLINGSTDAIITKLPSSLPSGIFTNKTFTDLVLSDSFLTLSADTGYTSGTPSGSLNLVVGGLTLSVGSLTLNTAAGGVVVDTTLLNAASNVFKVAIGTIENANAIKSTVTFSAVANDGATVVGKSIDVNVYNNRIITSIYGGAADDQVYGITTDSNGNVFAVGYTTNEGTGPQGTLIIKYDSNLNILLKKRYGGMKSGAADTFNSVITDSLNNVICVGSSGGDAVSGSAALIVKFDNNLTILARKYYGGTTGWSDVFNSVAIDSLGNIICVGFSSSETTVGYSKGFVVKFDTNLTVLSKMKYGAGTQSTNFNGVAVDSNDNIFVCGYTDAEGTASKNNGLLIKFDASLTIMARIYNSGSANNSGINSLTVDSSNNVICVGQTTDNIGSGIWGGFIFKFDNNLSTTPLIRKTFYYTSNQFQFVKVITDKLGNYIVVGYGDSETYGTRDGVIVTYDVNLNVIGKKHYGGASDEFLRGVAVDQFNNVYICGSTASAGTGGNDTLVVKIPANVKAGVFTGVGLPALKLGDYLLSLTSLGYHTFSASAGSVGTPGLAFGTSNLALNDSNLTQTLDYITM